jgi:hypothetical protein
MTVTRAGVVSWAQPGGDRLSYEVTLVATSAGGKKAVQTFRVFLPPKGGEPKKVPPEFPPKKEPDPLEPKKEPGGK